MIATLRKAVKQKSKFGGDVYLAMFKGQDGKSYRSWISPANGNFKRWQGILDKQELALDGLVVKGNLIDADSWPKIVR